MNPITAMIDSQVIEVWVALDCQGHAPAVRHRVSTLELAGEAWRDSADESWNNGTDAIYCWEISPDVSLYIYEDGGGGVASGTVTRGGIDDYLYDDCEYNRADCDGAEWLASWRVDGLRALEIAPADYVGAVRVWRTPNYYQGNESAPYANYEMDDDGDPREWPNAAAAQAWIDAEESAPSGCDGIPAVAVLRHGQAGPDGLTIVKA